jgi:hypothetical protein
MQGKIVAAYQKATILKLLYLEHTLITKNPDSATKEHREGDSQIRKSYLQRIVKEKRFKLETYYKKIESIVKNLMTDSFEEVININALALLEIIFQKGSATLQKGDAINLYILCYFLSYKFYVDDICFRLGELAKLTGYSKEMMLKLEVNVLKAVGFQVMADAKTLLKQDDELIDILRIYNEGKKSKRNNEKFSKKLTC